MDNIAFNGLVTFLCGTLSTDDLKRLGDYLLQVVEMRDLDSVPCPYTKEELNAMIDRAEAEIAAGLGTPSEEVHRQVRDKLQQAENMEVSKKSRKSSNKKPQLEMV